MNKRGEVTTGDLIVSFIAIIVCVVLIQQIFANESTATDRLIAYNETDTFANCWQNMQAGGAWQVNQSKLACNITVDRNTSGEWQYSGCPLTSVVMRNLTNSTAVSGTDYVVFGGVVALQNTTFWYNNTFNNTGNTTYLDYSFCGVGYNVDAGSRSIAGLWGLLAIIALFVAVGVKKDWFDNLSFN